MTEKIILSGRKVKSSTFYFWQLFWNTLYFVTKPIKFCPEKSTWAGKAFMIWRTQNNNIEEKQKTSSDWKDKQKAFFLRFKPP